MMDEDDDDMYDYSYEKITAKPPIKILNKLKGAANSDEDAKINQNGLNEF